MKMGEPQLKNISRISDSADISLTVIDAKKEDSSVAHKNTTKNNNKVDDEHGAIPNGKTSSSSHPHKDHVSFSSREEGLDNPAFSNPQNGDSKGRKRHISDQSLSLSFQDFSEDDDNVSLLYTRHEQLSLKNFSAEQRAIVDVEKFLSNSHIILNLHESNLDIIVDKMLHAMLDNLGISISVEDAKGTIFTHDNGPHRPAHQLCKTIQGTCISGAGGGVDYDQSWLCILTSLPGIDTRYVCIARLSEPSNLGQTSQEVYFVILVVTPLKEKGTKTAVEVGRTFSTLFADIDLRSQLLAVSTEDEFRKCIGEEAKALAEAQSKHDNQKFSLHAHGVEAVKDDKGCHPGFGIVTDFKRRIKFYLSDFKDGFFGHRTLQKTFSTTLFLYFAILLPSIALGVLNDKNLDGAIGVKHVLYSQTVGGIFFAIFGGQPMVILMTTAPLAIYSKVIFNISKDMDMTFAAMYACTGLWNGFFLIIYSVFGASRLMKWCSRSTEEIFALFISIAFTVDATKDVVKNFNSYYAVCDDDSSTTVAPTTTESNVTSVMSTVTALVENGTAITSTTHDDHYCSQETSLLFLLLVLGTLWVGLTLFNFTKTPFLNASKREILADYALAVAVLVMSFFGSFVFKDVEQKPFTYYAEQEVFQPAAIQTLSIPAIFVCCGLGFCLSLLFFMDQNISASMVNSPENKLKKGTAYHWDLLVMAILNSVLTMFQMPMMHGALPHSPLHVRAMADMEDRVDNGHVYQTIMHVRENRITALISHILIGLSLLLLPTPLQYIPVGVLDGLFLYLAVTALSSNQFFERISLFFTEQAAYPPNHYIRTVPQRKVHLFTLFQLIQLAVMCAFGFSPIAYMKMCFPVLILLLLPIRHNLIPKAMEPKHLKSLDGH